MRRFSLAAAVLAASLAWAVPAQAQGHAHSHGRLSLDVAVDATVVTLVLAAPLDDLLGFERAPRSVAERGRVTALADQLRAADKLFVFDPDGGCQLGEVQIESALLGLGAVPAPAKGEPVPEHGDLDLTAVFRCDKPARFVDVKLFNAFSRVRTVDVQLATAKGQSRIGLRKAVSRLALDGSAP